MGEAGFKTGKARLFLNRLSDVIGDMLGVEAGDTDGDDGGDGRLKDGLVEPDAGGGGEQLLKMRENGPCA